MDDGLLVALFWVEPEHSPWDTARRAQPSARLSFCCTPPLPLVVVSTVMERGCQQNDSLTDGHRRAVMTVDVIKAMASLRPASRAS